MKTDFRMTTMGLLLLGLPLSGCSSHSRQENAGDGVTAPAVQVRLTGSESVLPKATAFRMNGDYADKVAVTLNADGTLLYYPAPGDISANSAPVSLGDGWWLNRQGLGAGSVFTKWTFAEYAALASTPSRQEILEAVIPGSAVTEIVTLPLYQSEAVSQPELCRQYLPVE